jgi:toxin ParE1/3/4
MDYQVVLSPTARTDLRSIVRYISYDSPDRAQRFGSFLIARAKELALFPRRGREVPELADPLIREIIVRSYRLIYRLDDARQRVEIVRFWHAARGAPEIR